MIQLNPGDQFAYDMGGAFRPMLTIFTVTRTTATQIVGRTAPGACEAKFSKKNGRMVGSLSHKTVHPLTDEIRGMVERDELALWLTRLCDKDRALTLKTLRAMKAAYESAV